jgi:hypothetical protein
MYSFFFLSLWLILGQLRSFGSAWYCRALTASQVDVFAKTAWVMSRSLVGNEASSYHSSCSNDQTVLPMAVHRLMEQCKLSDLLQYSAMYPCQTCKIHVCTSRSLRIRDSTFLCPVAELMWTLEYYHCWYILS